MTCRSPPAVLRPGGVGCLDELQQGRRGATPLLLDLLCVVCVHAVERFSKTFVATVELPEKAHPFGRQSLRFRCVWVETGIDGRLDLLDQLGPRRLDVADGLLTQLLAAFGQIGQLFLAEVLLHGFVHG